MTLKKIYDIIIVNDTVTTLLMGLSVDREKQFSGYLGAILGTGMNIAYAETNEAITKITTDNPKKKQVINIESGEFTGYLTGSLPHEFNEMMAPKGCFSFEKAMSGAYLGPLIAHVLLAMCKENIFLPILHKHSAKSQRTSPLSIHAIS